MNPSIDRVPRFALVTGASRGIGRAIALTLATSQDKVALLGRDRERLAAVAGEVRALGAEAEVLVCDLASIDAVELALDGLLQAWGRIDVLVNNAGFGGPFHRVDEVSIPEWTTLFTTNMTAVHALTRKLLPGMKERGFGRIVNISSIQGLFGGAGSSTYASTKHAMNGYTHTVAVEWGAFGITCNAICPGYIETDMLAGYPDEDFKAQLRARIPVHRFGRPEEVASLAAFLAGDAAAFINGAMLTIDGGMSASLT